MKLLNKSLTYISLCLFFFISAWAVIFYFNMLQEIKESVDEGLENYKRQIIYNAQHDDEILTKHEFKNGFYNITAITKEHALGYVDEYIDTMMYQQDADDEAKELEPVRLLRTAFETNGNYYELNIINSMVEEDDLVKELLIETLGLYIGLLVVIISLNTFILKRLWRPFYTFIDQLKAYQLGTPEPPKINTATKEFVDLQEAINVLLEHNTATYLQQKQFIGNASHELQTPLAIVMNKLELLLENGNLESNQAIQIGEVLRIVERLIKLNKALLLITKIENKQFITSQIVSIPRVVEKLYHDISDIAEFKEVDISLEFEHTSLDVSMNETLASIVLANLIRNAIFHNHEGGKVIIQIINDALIIKNTGVSKALDASQIFNRFYKTDTIGHEGTGLGLAIIKAICEVYNFKIHYAFEDEWHIFKINFPSA